MPYPQIMANSVKPCLTKRNTDKSLIEISTYLSFSSQSYFQTVFRKVTGHPPTEWRRNNPYTKVKTTSELVVCTD